MRAQGRVWLVSLRPKGTHSQNGTLAGEVGPLPVLHASSYELLVANVASQPGTHSAVHTHPGPEAWYLLAHPDRHLVSQLAPNLTDRWVIRRDTDIIEYPDQGEMKGF